MSDNTCQVCPTIYYFTQGILCIECHSTCYTCKGKYNSNCLKCATGLYLKSTSTCDLCVSDGYYINGELCSLCDPNCKKCTSNL